MEKVLMRLLELQKNCANITLSIGGTSDSGQVMHNVIIIKDCPPVVVSTIVKEFNEGYIISMHNQGLMISTLGGK